jgi:hypothetical protein
MNRRTLAVALAVLATTGVIAFGIPFILSLKPAERARAVTFSVEVGGPPLGTVRTFRCRADFLIAVRSTTGRMFAFRLPVRDGRVAMPDIHWWKAPIYLCRDFGLDSARVDERATFRCADSDVPDWWASRWRWRIDGKNTASAVDDMPAEQFQVNEQTMYMRHCI